METVTDFIFSGYKPLRTVTAAMKLKDVCSLEKSYDKPRQYIKKQRHHLANKNPYSLENPRDGGAWWTAVYGVTQSRTAVAAAWLF